MPVRHLTPRVQLQASQIMRRRSRRDQYIVWQLQRSLGDCQCMRHSARTVVEVARPRARCFQNGGILNQQNEDLGRFSIANAVSLRARPDKNGRVAGTLVCVWFIEIHEIPFIAQILQRELASDRAGHGARR
jgi:hypothetical protein